MIKVESITIKEFRGIRDLTLELKGESFAICGPNGTGKSGVVDALEFVLTGNVSRLSGEGKGDVSLKLHGPHVDRRNDPDKARILAKLSFPNLAKTVVIERSVKSPGVLTVTPDDPEAVKLLQELARHPEIVLSRREIIRYVLATPGKRADEVQALLHLDQVEQVRVGLQKIANTCERQLNPLVSATKDARNNLLRALDTTELTAQNVLAGANVRRAVLGLAGIAELTATTSLKDGMASPKPGQPQRIPKTQALADIKSAGEVIKELSGPGTGNVAAQVAVDLAALATDPALLTGINQERFYFLGMELIGAEGCPFCDTQWDLVLLRGHVEAKVQHLKEVSRKRAATEKKIAPLIGILQKVRAAVDGLVGYALLAKPVLTLPATAEFSASCKSSANALACFVPIADSSAVLKTVASVPQSVIDEIASFEKVVAALPEPTKQDAAREWLTVAQERLEVWRESRRKEKVAREQAERARLVSNLYASTSDKVLAGIYAQVEKGFASLYGFVNRDDEKDFKAQLVPSMGKLGFEVDFYGRGFFPPGAYHSEGHQDGMGLCLYLALMRHLNGPNFTFAVLDDVLMSVDAAHRREACVLLKREFPNTQFVVTTHDPIWLRHMKTEGLIGGRSAVQFRGWNVDQGPTYWGDRDVWSEMEEHLAKNDVRAAAALLRHYLEYLSAELCHRLRASVEFRGDARYQLGELLPAAVSRMRKLYGKGKEAASSWNQKAVVDQIAARAALFGASATKSNVEQWQVNVAVHFNSWENLEQADFAPVVNAFRELLGGFACSSCGEYLRVSPERDAVESLRCDCGGTNINLAKKMG